MEDSSLDLQNDPFINKHHGNKMLSLAPDVRAEFDKAGINTHFIPFIRNCILVTRTPKISHILGSHDI
ncbi:hypothetical protein NC652_040503 [Populus alba x Populus x berolinensis]|nr:hypothetical protein NC652_040503 [Populus alba x Populus x berolinensis]